MTKSLTKGIKVDKQLVVTSPNKKLTDEPGGRQNLTFSFRFFKQKEPWFAFSGKQDKWFVSLIERLKDVSKKTIDFRMDSESAKVYRFHGINWEQKGIPVDRNYFDWVDKKYLANQEEFEFMQFEISTGTGRVIGFFDETGCCFNIVVIDPAHNMQPSKKHDWKIRKTQILDSEIECLHAKIAKTALLKKELDNEANEMLSFEKYEYFVMDKEFYQYFEKWVEDGTIRHRWEEFVMAQL